MGTGNCPIQPGGPIENLVIELLDLAGRSLSILRLHVNFGDLHYGPYPGKDEDKLYEGEREVYRALGKLAEEKLIRDIRIPAEEIEKEGDSTKKAIIMLAILLSTATCTAGEMWTFPVTFEEYNISETLEPYLITEEEWPPVVIEPKPEQEEYK